MIKEKRDLSKYEKQIKGIYPFLSDDFIEELTIELYNICENSINKLKIKSYLHK